VPGNRVRRITRRLFWAGWQQRACRPDRLGSFVRILRSLRPAAIAILAALALVLTACSGGDDDNAGANTGTSTLTAEQALAKVGQQLDNMRSWSFTLDMKSSGDAALNMKGTGQYQREPSLAMQLKLDSLQAAGQSLSGAEVLLVDNTFYLHLGELSSALGGKHWVKVGGNAMGMGELLDQLAQIDPSTQMEAFVSSGNATVDGSEEIDGVKTTKYSATVSADKLGELSSLDAAQREALKKSYDELGIKEVNYTVWVDDKYQPRRLVVVTPSSAGDVTVTMNIADINKPVDLSAPPADQVADLPGGS
jgi:hypothetical protein